jgi:antitoxin component YwqK of YwqJK toxin-antitoxin module
MEPVITYIFPLQRGKLFKMKVFSLEDRDGLMFEPKGEKSFTGTYFIYWNDGNEQQKEAINYKNGVLDGLYTKWYENGQKSLEANFKNGKLNGLETIWYENGQKKYELNWKDDEGDSLLSRKIARRNLKETIRITGR